MTTFQKEILLEACSTKEQRDIAEKLLKKLEMAAIDFGPLAIPVIDLDFEKVLPAGTASEFIRKLEAQIDKIMHSAIVFDLYFPSKKWVMNIEQWPTVHLGPEYLPKSVEYSIYKLFKSAEIDTNIFSIDFFLNNKPYNIKTILLEATLYHLNKQDITHPSDYNPSLRSMEAAGKAVVFSEDKIDTFINYLKN